MSCLIEYLCNINHIDTALIFVESEYGYLHNVLEFGINDVEIHYLWRHITRGYGFWSSKTFEGGYHVTAYAYRCSFGQLTFNAKFSSFVWLCTSDQFWSSLSLNLDQKRIFEQFEIKPKVKIRKLNSGQATFLETQNSFELPKLVLEEVWINPGVQLFWKWCNMPQLPVYNFGLNRFMCVWTLKTKLSFWRNRSSISFVPSMKLHPNYAFLIHNNAEAEEHYIYFSGVSIRDSL